MHSLDTMKSEHHIQESLKKRIIKQKARETIESTEYGGYQVSRGDSGESIANSRKATTESGASFRRLST